MKDNTKNEIALAIGVLRNILMINCVSMATDDSGNLIFFDTNKYIKDRTFDGIKVNINDIVK